MRRSCTNSKASKHHYQNLCHHLWKSFSYVQILIVIQCSPCSGAGVACAVSTRLRRKTKVRGYRPPTAEEFQNLTADNAAMRQSLQALQESNQKLQSELARLSSRPLSAVSEHTRHRSPNHANLLLRHMGRIVVDEANVERFAGSTTGVHFILSVQQAVQRQGLLSVKFPDNCYRLHLLAPTLELHETSRTTRETYSGQQNVFQQALSSALMFGFFTDFASQVTDFTETWEPLCPIVAVATLQHRFSGFLNQLQTGGITNVEAHLERTTVFSVSTIILIQGLGSSQQNPEEKFRILKSIQQTLYPGLLSLANLDALQSIALLSLYTILTSQYNEMVKISGIMVQMAKSLGLHRHARRFKFSVGEVQTRSRLWWWIYMFDMYAVPTLPRYCFFVPSTTSAHRQKPLTPLSSSRITATIHGLPKVIHDADVDTDYPVDCDLTESTATELSLPLPGESTSIGGYITLVRLSRLLSRTLAELYTTTERRDSVRKMELLRDELKAWRQGIPNGQSPLSTAQNLWMSLAEDYMSVLIHRPGLTFDPATRPFSDCLRTCTAACSRMIRSATTLKSFGFPNGFEAILSSLIFQCALMVVLNHCHASSQENTNKDDVILAISFLTQCAGNPVFAHSPQLLVALSDARGLLQSLSQAMNGGPPSVASSSQSNALIESALSAAGGIMGEEMQLETPASMFGMDVDGSGLGELGQLESLDWIFDFNPEIPPTPR